jgi:predicted permease
MRAFLSDLAAAVRSFRASPGFTAVAVSTLGGGLALAVTVLTVVNAYALRSMPYPEADRLYRLDYAERGQWLEGLEGVAWKALDDVIETPIAWDLDVFFMLAGSDGTARYPESVPGAWVTPGYLEGFGIRTALGRTLGDSDYHATSPPVAVISHRLWQSRFDGDPAIVGRTFTAYVSDRPDEAETITIVGVLPADHWHFNAYSEVLTPLRADTYPYFVRLRRGVSREVAVDRISTAVRATLPDIPADWRVVITPIQTQYIATIGPLLWAVAVAAALVLTISGANVAVLLLVRSRRRQLDLAVRLALGAGPARLARMLLLEGLLLGAAALAIGVGASRLAIAWLGSSVESFLARRAPGGPEAFALDAAVLAMAAGCGLLVTMVFALVPLASLRPSRLASAFAASRVGSETKASRRARSLLISLEVAASLTLLSGSLLMAQSAVAMLDVDFGIDADRVATTSLSMRQRSYPDAASQAALLDRIAQELTGVAGSEAVGLGSWWPLQSAPARPVRVPGGAEVVNAGVQAVSAGYFETLGIRLVNGRAFEPRDTTASEPVVIVGASLARRLWSRESPIDQTLEFVSDTGSSTARRVVGVVNDVRQTHVDENQLDAYVPLLQRPDRSAYIYVRGPRIGSWQTEARERLGAIDPELALGTPRWLGASLDQERAAPRFLARLLGAFGAIASVLALVGLHGVIAYAVRQRQREVAIRMAIGAGARDVTRLFLRHGIVVLGVGIGAGLWGATALGHLLQNYLHGVEATDPAVLAVAAVAFGVCGLFAVWWPAWRAALTNPAGVLRD